jgi:hypothetical protein
MTHHGAHEFALRGKKGLGIYDHFPKTLSDCHEFGCMEVVPANTADPLVCTRFVLISLESQI